MDHCSVRDRYARAVRADDLTPYRGSRFAPADVLAAAGMAAQRRELGMLLQRLRAEPDPPAVAMRVAGEALAERLREAVRRREVRRDGVDSGEVAREALAWWLEPTCLQCGGVRFQAANGRLLARSCQACGGSGRRDEPAAPAARWVIDLIQAQVARSEGEHRRAMR